MASGPPAVPGEAQLRAAVEVLQMPSATPQSRHAAVRSLLGVDAPSAAQAGALGCVEALLALLAARPADYELQLEGLFLLQALTAPASCADNRRRAFSAGGLAVVLAALDAHAGGDAHMARIGCFALARVCELQPLEVDAAFDATVTSTRVVEVALEAMRAHPGVALVQAGGCLAVCTALNGRGSVTATTAARVAALRTRAREADLFTTAVTAMRTFPADRAVQMHACAAVADACAHDDAAKTSAADAGAVEAVAAVLLTFHGSADGLRPLGNALLAMCNMCLRNAGAQARAMRAGALANIVAVMRAHPESAELNDTGASALSNIVADAFVHRLAAGAAGAIPVLLSALRDSRGTRYCVCHALAAVCGNVQPNQAAAVAAGALQVVLDAMAAAPAERHMQREGCFALACICKDKPTHVAAALAAGALDAVIAALAAFPADADASATALDALRTLLVGSEARAYAGGAAAHAVAALRARTHAHAAATGTADANDISVIKRACFALNALAKHDAGGLTDAVSAAGAIEAAVDAMMMLPPLSAASADDADVENAHFAGCRLLRTLAHHGDESHCARAVRAGATELLAGCVALTTDELHEKQVQLQQALRDAKERHDAAAPDDACLAVAGGGCRRCATLRARGVLCALAGCRMRRCAASRTVAANDAAQAEQEAKKMQYCSICTSVAYCCGEHQRGDWARHKGECAALAAAHAARAVPAAEEA
jgi:hypothetical protein